MFALAAGMTLLAAPFPPAPRQAAATADVDAFDARVERLSCELERLMVQHRIPGLSAALVRERKIAWSRGFGLADLECEVWALPETRYRIASVSKPLAAVLVLQLVEQEQLSLAAPMKDFRIGRWFAPDPARYREQPVLVRHVLTHTSAGIPGESYAYDGNIYSDLTWVLEDVTGIAYPRLLQERILDPAGMERSVPGHTRAGEIELVGLARAWAPEGPEFLPVGYQMADPDPRLDLTGFDPVLRMPEEAVALRRERLGAGFMHWNGVSAAAGIVSTVLDLAKFDIALDEGRLIRPESRELMFTPARSSSGAILPYALGWFVEEIAGRKVCWHYGWLPPSVSALYVKVPEAELTFLLLANNDGLSRGFSWTREGLRASPFARAFLETFALAGG
jgi:CubicO group peptidase (beta-lactamase class C family)